jgi:hypothetical protein
MGHPGTVGSKTEHAGAATATEATSNRQCHPVRAPVRLSLEVIAPGFPGLADRLLLLPSMAARRSLGPDVSYPTDADAHQARPKP